MQTTTEHRTIDKRYVSVWASGSCLISYDPNKKKIQYTTFIVVEWWSLIISLFHPKWLFIPVVFSSIFAPWRSSHEAILFVFASMALDNYFMAVQLYSEPKLFILTCLCVWGASDGEKFLHLSRVSKHKISERNAAREIEWCFFFCFFAMKNSLTGYTIECESSSEQRVEHEREKKTHNTCAGEKKAAFQINSHSFIIFAHMNKHKR